MDVDVDVGMGVNAAAAESDLHHAPHTAHINSSSSSTTSRRLLQLAINDEFPTAPNLVGMNIFNIFATPQRMPYTFVVDAGFYSLFNSVRDVQAAVTAVVVASNVILAQARRRSTFKSTASRS